MSKIIQSVRGMNDLLPPDSEKITNIIKIISDIFIKYGYSYIRTPIVENTQTFSRAIGEATDIVAKEMYSWQDGKNSLSLRPEGTAAIVRAVIEHNLVRNNVQKFFYSGAMFRHERPQKGRYREFYQIGAEVFGADNIKIDAEVITMSSNILHNLDIKATLQINSLGSNKVREDYKKQLIIYFTKNISILDDDSKRRLKINPLRILDSKNDKLQNLIKEAPKLIDILDDKSNHNWQQLLEYLSYLGVDYHINPTLVRGLDYYNNTVFEWISNDLGTQGAICAGGRYDSLVERMGGKPTKAIGFALGLERIALLVNKQLTTKPLSICLIASGDMAQKKSLKIAEILHKNFINLVVDNDMSFASFKAQFKKADKKNISYAIIIGENEVNNNNVTIKSLATKQQQTLLDKDIVNFLQGKL